MKVIGIISNNEKQEALEISKTVYDFLKQRNIEVLLPDEDVLPDRYSLQSVSQEEFSFPASGCRLAANRFDGKNKELSQDFH